MKSGELTQVKFTNKLIVTSSHRHISSSRVTLIITYLVDTVPPTVTERLPWLPLLLGQVSASVRGTQSSIWLKMDHFFLKAEPKDLFFIGEQFSASPNSLVSTDTICRWSNFGQLHF